MKQIILLASLAVAVLAVDCNQEFAKLHKQINRARLVKNPNQIKLNYLFDRLFSIEEACIDGQIDKYRLKEIEFACRINFRKDKLAADWAKLEKEYAALATRKSKLDAKARKLKAAEEELQDYLP